MTSILPQIPDHVNFTNIFDSETTYNMDVMPV